MSLPTITKKQWPVTMKNKIGGLAHRALALLDRIAAGAAVPTDQDINDLDSYAARISKLAYGNNRPEYVSSEMHALISWCDHINEEPIRSQFIEVLTERPLRDPPWDSS